MISGWPTGLPADVERLPLELRKKSRDQIGDLWFESTSRLEGLSETEKKQV